MTMPYYVAPEQVMKDRAEYAQKGIARGRALIATIYDGGVLLVAENPSATLHKISEIYDRIAFAGTVFTHEMKPMEVEILVAELGNGTRSPQIFRIAYEGTITDEVGFAVLGGDAEAIRTRFANEVASDWVLSGALRHAVAALGGPDRRLDAGDLEVAVLADTGERRTFRRLEDDEVTQLLAN